ncbi:acetyltransferase [Arthrobacter sp. NPDC090010]|uniref:acetyltransferase n=1 Tax=Arthrobacter sp. NPDC090010 TaxID=3363942 RepID=UPI0038145266
MSTLIIRDCLGPEEHPRLVEIWRSAVDATHHFLAAADRDEIEQQLAAAYFPQVRLTVAEREGHLLGFAGTAEDRLEMLFVEASAQGQGIGTALLGHAIRHDGARAVDVNEQNPEATAFYKSQGFRVRGRSETDDAGRPYPLLHLALAAARPRPHLIRRGSGTPVLFIHGNGVDHRLLLDLDDAFADGPWERIHLDLAGFGQTPALDDDGGLPQLADWLDDLVAETVGEAPFAVVGNSLGGLLARELTARRPSQVLGMALLAPVVDPVQEHRTLPKRTVLHRDEALLNSLRPGEALKYQEMAVVQSPENWERFRSAALPGLKAADTQAMDRLAARYLLDPMPEERLRGYTRPVLIVAGRQDHVVGFHDQEVLARQFPDARYVALDRAGHNVHLDQPLEVRMLLGEWLARLHS